MFMVDMFSKDKRSKIMSNIRCKDTSPEKLFFDQAKKLWHMGFIYRKHYKKIPGKPDLAFPRQKLAVFVDSEFWHGKDYSALKDRLPEKYWQEKILENKTRDKRINTQLKKMKWRVARIWVKDLKKNGDKFINQLRTELI